MNSFAQENAHNKIDKTRSTLELRLAGDLGVRALSREMNSERSIQLPVDIIGAPVDADVVNDFENSSLPGLVYRVDARPFVQDDSYDGWYKKAYWGQAGAGIYVHSSLEATLQYQKERGGKSPVPYLSTLRVSEAKCFPLDGESLEMKLPATDEVIDAYQQSLRRYAAYQEGSNTSWHDGLGGYYVDTVMDFMESVKESPEELREELTFGVLRRAYTYQPFLDFVVNTLPDDFRRERLLSCTRPEQAWTLSMQDGDRFALFLEAIGYDGVSYGFNHGHEALVVWNLSRIGTKDTWRQRLVDG